MNGGDAEMRTYSKGGPGLEADIPPPHIDGYAEHERQAWYDPDEEARAATREGA
jgi:hypothetical protein